MKQIIIILQTLGILWFGLVCATEVQAQATRTWVSGTGDDGNQCSRTAPCRTFAGAISKTAAGGEIDCLDPGGFGVVTITKSITIDGSGTFGSILAAASNGIVINAAASDKVVIRGLSLNGIGTGLSGIRFLAGASLHVEDCVISGFSTGIEVNKSAAAKVYLRNTVTRNNSSSGVFLFSSTGTVDVALENCQSTNNGSGIVARNNTCVAVHGGAFSGNGTGILAQVQAGAGNAQVNVVGANVSSNGTGLSCGAGIAATSTIRISQVQVTSNNTGLSLGNGTLETFLDNIVRGNTTNVVGTVTTDGVTKADL